MSNPLGVLDEVRVGEMLIKRDVVSSKCLFGEMGLDEMSCTRLSNASTVWYVTKQWCSARVLKTVQTSKTHVSVVLCK